MFEVECSACGADHYLDTREAAEDWRENHAHRFSVRIHDTDPDAVDRWF